VVENTRLNGVDEAPSLPGKQHVEVLYNNETGGLLSFKVVGRDSFPPIK